MDKFFFIDSSKNINRIVKIQSHILEIENIDEQTVKISIVISGNVPEFSILGK